MPHQVDKARVRQLENMIASAAPDYYPNLEVCSQLEDKVVVPVTAPVATGKSTLILRIPELDSSFGDEVGFTTRDIRRDEPEDSYRFIGHTVSGLAAILEKVQNGDLVQYDVHPTLGKIYGSEVEDYQHPFCVVDISANNMGRVLRLPFQECVSITLTAPVEQWINRLHQRSNSMSEQEYYDRLVEGRQSIEWSLDQGNDTSWVVNKEGQLDQAALEVIGVARKNISPNPSNRRLGELMLKTIRRLIND